LPLGESHHGIAVPVHHNYHHVLDGLFGPLGVKPRIVAECDTFSSLITAIESGRGIALSTSVFKQATGKRLVYRPLTGTNEVLSVGIARARNGDITPAGEKFCEILRNVAKPTVAAKSPKGIGRWRINHRRPSSDVQRQKPHGPARAWLRLPRAPSAI
jgi:DNA-binding transcriptional LysR family regulator